MAQLGKDQKKKVIKRSVVPVYVLGVTLILYALIFPFYRWMDFIIAALVSIVIFFVCRKLFPDKIYYIDIPIEDQTLTEDEKLIAEGELYVEALRKLSIELIEYNHSVAEQTANIQQIFSRIVAHIGKHPDDIPKVRRSIDFYLPTVVKYLNSYLEIKKKNVQGEHSSSIIKSVEQSLHSTVTALSHLEDKLYADDKMDISSDITVLEHFFEQEGLTGANQTKTGGNG